jgi:hypothetical protein
MRNKKLFDWYGSGGGEELTNVSLPLIYGFAARGFTLTAFEGTFSEQPSAFTYQWKRDGVNIGGATARTYVVTASDVGTSLTVTVSGTGISSVTSAGFPISSTRNYAAGSSYESIWDYSGLVVNTNNAYGIVDVSGNITTLKSVAPGPTGRDLTVNGTGPTLSGGRGVFGGAGSLRHNVAATYEFMHRNATAANYKLTIRVVAKPGTIANPNAAYGFLGNNAASAANKGTSFWNDDRAASSRNNGLKLFTTQSGGNATFNITQDDIIIPNELHVYRIEAETVGPDAFKVRVHVDGRLHTVGVVYSATAMIATPSFVLEVGGVGNGTFLYTGEMAEIQLQSAIDSDAIAVAMDLALINHHGVTPNQQVPTVDTTQALNIFDTYQAAVGDYYLSAAIDQHPWKPYTGVRVFSDGVDHAYDATKEFSVQVMSKYGLAYGVKSTLIAPTNGTTGQVDGGGGYFNCGRHCFFSDAHGNNGSAFFAPRFAYFTFTDDDYATKTTVDITSLIPVDGLNSFRFYGNAIENNGYLLYAFTKLKDETIGGGLDITSSAIYMLRLPVNADPTVLANWSVTTVYPPTVGPYISEPAIAAKDNNIGAMCRNETSKEWNLFTSADNGATTFTSRGDVTLGETFTVASPGRFVPFTFMSTPCFAFIYPNRTLETLRKTICKQTELFTLFGSAFTTPVTIANTGRRLHYGDYFSIAGNYCIIGGSPYEKSPLDLSNNDFVQVIIPSTNYATDKTALGL